MGFVISKGFGVGLFPKEIIVGVIFKSRQIKLHNLLKLWKWQAFSDENNGISRSWKVKKIQNLEARRSALL